jgi:hypothetical protein
MEVDYAVQVAFVAPKVRLVHVTIMLLANLDGVFSVYVLVLLPSGLVQLPRVNSPQVRKELVSERSTDAS